MISKLLSRWIAKISLIVTAVALFLHYCTFSNSDLLAFVSLMPWLLILTFINLILLIKLGTKFFVFLALLILLAYINVFLPYIKNNVSNTTNLYAVEPISVLASNLYLGKADSQQLAKIITEKQVNIFVATELTAEFLEKFTETEIKNYFPYQYIQPALHAQGAGIWSKYPILNSRILAGFTFNNLAAQIQINGMLPVNFFVTNVVPPLESSTLVWESELHTLSSILEHNKTNTTIMVGSFNASFNMKQYRKLLFSPYKDASLSVGKPYIFTYPSDRFYPAIVTLDHLITNRLVVDEFSGLNITGSDHKAILIKLKLN